MLAAIQLSKTKKSSTTKHTHQHKASYRCSDCTKTKKINATEWYEMEKSAKY